MKAQTTTPSWLAVRRLPEDQSRPEREILHFKLPEHQMLFVVLPLINKTVSISIRPVAHLLLMAHRFGSVHITDVYTIPKETLLVALSIAAARLLVCAIAYCLLLQGNRPGTRNQRNGQFIISIFLFCSTTMAVFLTYRRVNESCARETVSLSFPHL